MAIDRRRRGDQGRGTGTKGIRHHRAPVLGVRRIPPGAIAVTGIFLVAGAIPLLSGSRYYLVLFGLGAIYALVAQATNLVLGIAGQASFAHAAFFGVGAYTSALTQMEGGVPIVLAAILAVLAAALLGAIVGFPAGRLKGFYLALVTLGVAQLFVALVGRLSFFGASQGLLSIPPLVGGGFFGASVLTSGFVVVWVVSWLGIIALISIGASHLGRLIRSLRASDIPAASVGVRVHRLKAILMSLTAAFMGLAGFLYAGFFGYIDPHTFGLSTTILIVVMVVVGGRMHPVGPVVGAAVLSVLPQMLRSYPGFERIAYGGILIVALVFAPEGLAIMGKRTLRRTRERLLR